MTALNREMVTLNRRTATLSDAKVCVTNIHTGQKILIPIKSNGEFIGAFVDMKQNSVVVIGDEIAIQLIGSNGIPLTEPQRYIVSYEDILNAYLKAQIPAMPNQTKLFQNYPNPFNPETWIPFQLSQDSSVKIEIYDVNGHKIRSLDLGYRQAGWYISNLDKKFFFIPKAYCDKMNYFQIIRRPCI